MIDYWHNPRCSKSRGGLTLLQEQGQDVSVRLYLTDAPDLAQITAVWRALGSPPAIDMMRKGDSLFKELGLDATASDDALIRAMAAHPALIERPIAIRGDKAVIGRPTERLQELVVAKPA